VICSTIEEFSKQATSSVPTSTNRWLLEAVSLLAALEPLAWDEAWLVAELVDCEAMQDQSTGESGSESVYCHLAVIDLIVCVVLQGQHGLVPNLKTRN